MKCKEIIDKLEELYPSCLAESWDNPGLLVGRKDREVTTILTALDLTEETLSQAIECGAQMVVAHHPLIFGSIKKVNDDSFLGRRILTLIEKGISLYCMHTNFDVRGMAALNAGQLELVNTEPLEVTAQNGETSEGIGKVGSFSSVKSLQETAELVKSSMNLQTVRVYGNLDKEISRVAVCGGSGKSMIGEALSKGANVMITGDVDYHSAIDAVAQNLCVIDAGHYGTEYHFIHCVAEDLKKTFPDLCVIEARVVEPFVVL